MGPWVNILFYSWIELCYTNSLHPFTGDKLSGTDLHDALQADPQNKQDVEEQVKTGDPSTQRCFLDACNNTRDRLIQEIQSTVRLLKLHARKALVCIMKHGAAVLQMVVTVLLAALAVTLLGFLASREGWSKVDYASCTLSLLSFVCSFSHLAGGGFMFSMVVGRSPRTFTHVLLKCEPLMRAILHSFFASLNLLFAAVLLFTFDVAWENIPDPTSGAAPVVPVYAKAVLACACVGLKSGKARTSLQHRLPAETGREPGESRESNKTGVEQVKVKVGKSLHRLNFPVLTSSFRPLFDLPDAPSAVPPTSSEWVPGRPVPKPWRFY